MLTKFIFWLFFFFLNNIDEDDVFDSDFGSTDEEAAGEEDGEKRIEREAKAEARVS